VPVACMLHHDWFRFAAFFKNLFFHFLTLARDVYDLKSVM